MGKFILKRVMFSSKKKSNKNKWDYEDEDFIEDLRNDVENQRVSSAFGSTTFGGILGGAAGHSMGGGKGMLLGAGLGAAAGVGLHKKVFKPSIYEEGRRKEEKYKRISDKEGRRRMVDRYESDKSRREAAHDAAVTSAILTDIFTATR